MTSIRLRTSNKGNSIALSWFKSASNSKNQIFDTHERTSIMENLVDQHNRKSGWLLVLSGSSLIHGRSGKTWFGEMFSKAILGLALSGVSSFFPQVESVQYKLLGQRRRAFPYLQNILECFPKLHFHALTCFFCELYLLFCFCFFVRHLYIPLCLWHFQLILIFINKK